jgi:hypothetical protein
MGTTKGTLIATDDIAVFNAMNFEVKDIDKFIEELCHKEHDLKEIICIDGILYAKLPQIIRVHDVDYSINAPIEVIEHENVEYIKVNYLND